MKISKKSKEKLEKKEQKPLTKQMKAKPHQEKLKKHPRKMPKPNNNVTFHFQLFLHRQELRKPKADYSHIRLSRSKIMLTAHLINQNMANFNKTCTVEDLKILSREVQYKKRLCQAVERLEQYQALGLTDIVLDGRRTPL